ncbi:Nudix hydrolase 15, mitochondrial [Dendrobium catenatum]|uniref:Nudix hydrolase 15, mitochondrial n=1 Tax=Dendrobium catenatum TaxID=906689 RepID=A0A2I0X6Z8_9ASPA|nr:Nudix hydrolase 15, mitochondrial [Dendrobium catenatum]
MIAASLRSLVMAASSNSYSYNLIGPTRNLNNLIQQLRLYKAPRFGGGVSDEDDEVDERGKVFSQMGLGESAMRPMPPAFKSQDKRAAVLVCLFEGDHGDLRVFLTKRSSNLSSHSGRLSLSLSLSAFSPPFLFRDLSLGFSKATFFRLLTDLRCR